MHCFSAGDSGTLTAMASEIGSAAGEFAARRRSEVPLAPLTTLELGGAARHLVEVESVDAAVEAVRWARAQQLDIAILGGGSNLVVADRGFEGLVVRVVSRGLEMTRDGSDVIVAVAAGEPWDELVALTVDEGLAGIECLSGIPGAVGATPIQNVGAYGQEVARVIERVRALDLQSLEERTLPPEACGFGYRTSCFRERAGRFLVLAVSYRLAPGGTPTVVYDELRRALEASAAAPPLAEVREAVLALRRAKSMVIDPEDPNRRSAGSFFVNPVIDVEALAELELRARVAGVLAESERVPAHPASGGLFKVPAGWLIERAGFAKGLRRGPVGISTKHALALVHHGGGTAAELVALARDIRDGVRKVFGLTLEPEPVFLGFETSQPLER
jgi:UDP-N-acetylmuramate dehydrogenase